MRSLRRPKTKILFLTKYVCRSSVDFQGPIGERYAGLYYSFMERFRFDYEFYWHTADGETFEYEGDSNTLRTLPRITATANRLSLIRVLLSFCIGNCRCRKIIIVSYPNFPKSMLLAVLLFLLRPFHLTVIVDVQDLALPRERPWTMSYLFWWIVNELFFRYASFILNASECAKLYARRARSTIVIPMAAHHNIITPSPSAVRRCGLTLAYVGSLEHRRGFPRVIEEIKNLRLEGFHVNLVINGNKPENFNLDAYPWVRFYDKQPLESLAELLRMADVGIIPYVDRDYWGLLSITKMATYMSAGLAILSLHLTETSNIIAKWECGVSVEDWNGFAAAVKAFYHDPALVQRLGENGRRAAVQEYNWEKQVQKLGDFVRKLAS
jgi:glycosyltransferase involved in cell wall biosynthesis